MPRTVDREMARSWTEGFERWHLVRHSVEDKLLRRLVLARRPPPREEVLRWSAWRRNHQAVARRCHYRRRGVLLA